MWHMHNGINVMEYFSLVTTHSPKKYHKNYGEQFGESRYYYLISRVEGLFSDSLDNFMP